MPENSFVVRLEGDRYCPKIICARCGEAITDYADGTVAWMQRDVFDEGALCAVTVVCKKRGCAAAILRGRGIRSQSLRDYLAQLLHNLGYARLKAVAAR